MSYKKHYSVLKFSKWASEQKRFLVSVPETDKPYSITMHLLFEAIEVHPFFPVRIAFSGGSGSINLRYVTSVDKISENAFLLRCGREELPAVYREIVVTSG